MMNDFYAKTDTLISDLEVIPVVLATRLGPWITPMVPAYFVHRAMVRHLDVPSFWGWMAAIALELVGVAAMFNLLNMYQYNQERRKIDPPAPLKWAMVTTCSYYITAFALVLFVEFFPDVIKFAPAAFIVLSGSSAAVLALINDQKRRVRTIEMSRDKKRKSRGQKDKNKRTYIQNVPDLSGLSRNLSQAKQTKQKQIQERRRVILARIEQDGTVLPSTLAKDLGVSTKTIQRDIKSLNGVVKQ